jgi:hypothetical protein
MTENVIDIRSIDKESLNKESLNIDFLKNNVFKFNAKASFYDDTINRRIYTIMIKKDDYLYKFFKIIDKIYISEMNELVNITRNKYNDKNYGAYFIDTVYKCGSQGFSAVKYQEDDYRLQLTYKCYNDDPGENPEVQNFRDIMTEFVFKFNKLKIDPTGKYSSWPTCAVTVDLVHMKHL